MFLIVRLWDFCNMTYLFIKTLGKKYVLKESPATGFSWIDGSVWGHPHPFVWDPPPGGVRLTCCCIRNCEKPKTLNLCASVNQWKQQWYLVHIYSKNVFVRCTVLCWSFFHFLTFWIKWCCRLKIKTISLFPYKNLTYTYCFFKSRSDFLCVSFIFFYINYCWAHIKKRSVLSLGLWFTCPRAGALASL